MVQFSEVTSLLIGLSGFSGKNSKFSNFKAYCASSISEIVTCFPGSFKFVQVQIGMSSVFDQKFDEFFFTVPNFSDIPIFLSDAL